MFPVTMALYSVNIEGGPGQHDRPYWKVIVFRDSQDYFQWSAEIQRIQQRTRVDRDYIEANKEAIAAGDNEEVIFEYHRRLRESLANHRVFHERWGLERVPLDMRMYINEAEEELGLAITAFGVDVGGAIPDSYGILNY